MDEFLKIELEKDCLEIAELFEQPINRKRIRDDSFPEMDMRRAPCSPPPSFGTLSSSQNVVQSTVPPSQTEVGASAPSIRTPIVELNSPDQITPRSLSHSSSKLCVTAMDAVSTLSNLSTPVVELNSPDNTLGGASSSHSSTSRMTAMNAVSYTPLNPTSLLVLGAPTYTPVLGGAASSNSSTSSCMAAVDAASIPTNPTPVMELEVTYVTPLRSAQPQAPVCPSPPQPGRSEYNFLILSTADYHWPSQINLDLPSFLSLQNPSVHLSLMDDDGSPFTILENESAVPYSSSPVALY
eukprot:scaffold537_cov180-Ochromonas_danica.AAC.62